MSKTPAKTTKPAAKPAKPAPAKPAAKPAKPAPVETKAKAPAPAAPAPADFKIPKGGANVANLPCDKISVKKGFNPRSDLGDLTDLKRNLGEHGVISPITVCPTKEGADTYFVVAGHRRFAAWTELGKANIPAVIRHVDITSDEAFQIALSENSDDSRTELSPLDQAAAFKRLLDANGGEGAAESYVARVSGYSLSHVKRTLRLLTVPDSVRARLAKGEITKMAAIAVASVPDEVRDRVVAKVTPGVTEADVHRIANEEKRALRAESKPAKPSAQDDDEDEAPTKGEKKAAKEEKESNRNVPIGQIAGFKGTPQSTTAIRERIARVAVDVLNDETEEDDKDEEAARLVRFNKNSAILASLLWTVGAIPEIDPESTEFKESLEAIRARLEERMKAVAKGKTKAKAEEPAKKVAKPSKKAADEDDEDEAPAKPVKAAKPVADEDDDEDEAPKKPSKKAAKPANDEDDDET